MMNIEVLKIVRDNIKMGSVLSFAEVMIIQQAIDAAMLQSSQPVSNHDELQVIGWLRSDYNSDDKRDPNAPLFMLGSNDPSETWGVKYIPLSGSSPVIPDDWVSCSERMPEQGAYISAVSKHGEYVSGQVIDDWLDLHDGTSFGLDEVYLWMMLPPLPASPQQEAE